MSPFSRYGVFAGTTSRDEWRKAWSEYLARWQSHDDAEAIARYERRFAVESGCAHAFSFGAGRMALYAILEALGIGPGDEVIVPGFTCVVVPNAVLYRGARPVYVDIDPVTFNLDPGRVVQAISPRTRAICAQHTFGVACDMTRINEIARAHGLTVIEDCAHALGASFGGRKAGSLGEVAFFSTDRTKVINTMSGGIAATSDPKIAATIGDIHRRTPFLTRAQVRNQVRSFLAEVFLVQPRWYRVGRYLSAAHNRAGSLFYDEMQTSKPTRYPYPCRLSSAQANIGLQQLERLEANLRHRRAIAVWLEARIQWYSRAAYEYGNPSWLRYSFLVRDRNQFNRRMHPWLDPATWFTSVVQGRTTRLEEVGYRAGSCPKAEWVTRHIVNIPTHAGIPFDRIERAWRDHGAWIQSNLLEPAFATP